MWETLWKWYSSEISNANIGHGQERLLQKLDETSLKNMYSKTLIRILYLGMVTISDKRQNIDGKMVEMSNKINTTSVV